MYGYGYGYYSMFDPTMILVLIGVFLSLGASAKVKSTYARFSRVRSMTGMTGAEAARQLLNSQGIYDVQIRQVAGSLTDHYDPRTKTVNLSDAVYDSTSVAAIGVAAHECGHAVQHNTDYVPLWRRMSADMRCRMHLSMFRCACAVQWCRWSTSAHSFPGL